MIRNRLLFLSIAFCCRDGLSASVTENFSTTNSKATSTLVWNTALSQLHPPLQITGYNTGSGASNLTFDVGDGRHGSFNSATYANFGTVVGFEIQIDTDVYSDLQFTDFSLGALYTIKPIGSNPLIIRSLSTILIDGIITCSGDNGADINSDNSIVASGGQGRCGGQDGGLGGSISVSPTSGGSAGSGTTGGQSGPSGGALGGASGAGGGAFCQPATPATSGTNPNGGATAAAGFNFQDDAFAIISGGSGGGGGYFHNAGVNNSSGAGGGAGGGIILMYAVGNVTVNGSILAKGGNGGGGSNTQLGGGGGGGGGGSILIFSRGSVVLGGASVVSAEKGTGGVVTGAGADGGNGSDGRTWLTDDDAGATGPNELPPSLLLSFGNVEYQTGIFNATSSAVDLLNTKPVLSSVNLSSSGTGVSTLTMDYNEGRDFVPNYQSSGSLLGIELKRFVKFKVEINNTSGTAPAIVTGLTLNYEPSQQQEFDFAAACGSIGKGTPPNPSVFILFLLPLFASIILRQKA